MRRPKKDIQLTSYDELLGLEETPEKSMNQVVSLGVRTYPFNLPRRLDAPVLTDVEMIPCSPCSIWSWSRVCGRARSRRFSGATSTPKTKPSPSANNM